LEKGGKKWEKMRFVRGHPKKKKKKKVYCFGANLRINFLGPNSLLGVLGGPFFGMGGNGGAHRRFDVRRHFWARFGPVGLLSPGPGGGE